MKDLKTKFFISAVLIIISLPIILSALRIKVVPKNKMEKKITLSFNRNFPLKEDLFELYSYLKREIIGTNIIPNSVIEAKDGWKFLGNSYSNAFSESKGLLVFSNLELGKLEENLLKKKTWAENLGIQMFVSIAPNKLSVYGDMINIKKGRTTKLEQLDSICQKIGVNFVCLGELFKQNSDIDYYLKTDSHWNNYGGYYAYKTTIDAISKKYKNNSFCEIDINKYPIICTTWSRLGDLNNALYINEYDDFFYANYHKHLSFEFEDKKLKVPKDFPFKNSLYEERYSSEANDLKILVLRDSFFGGYYDLIANSFGNSVFVWSHQFDKEILKKEVPDILMYEIVERNIDLLLEEDYKYDL